MIKSPWKLIHLSIFLSHFSCSWSGMGCLHTLIPPKQSAQHCSNTSRNHPKYHVPTRPALHPSYHARPPANWTSNNPLSPQRSSRPSYPRIRSTAQNQSHNSYTEPMKSKPLMVSRGLPWFPTLLSSVSVKQSIQVNTLPRLFWVPPTKEESTQWQPIVRILHLDQSCEAI